MQVQIPDEAPLCPSEGYHSFVDETCGPAFIKCTKRPDTGALEGTVHRCPRGFSYWARSKRCEKTEKLPDCRKSRLSYASGLPVEWINLGRSRKLQI